MLGTETAEELANRVMQHFGFLVFGMTDECKIGEVLPAGTIGTPVGDLFGQPFMVIGVSDFAESTRHMIWAGVEPVSETQAWPYYYRVITE